MIQPHTPLAQRRRQCRCPVPRLFTYIVVACCLLAFSVIGQSHDESKSDCPNSVEGSYLGIGASVAWNQFGQKSPAYLAVAYIDTDRGSRNDNSDNAGALGAEQSRDENEKRCADPSDNSNLRIGACTALIKFVQESPEYLATAYMNRGNGYQDTGEYERAIQDYGQAILLKPDFVLAFYDRGNAYDSKGEYDRAIADYDQAIQLAPEGDHAYYAYYGRGYAYNAKGEYDRAIKDYDRAIRLNPDGANAFIVRGVANFLRANPSQAVIDFRRSSKLNPKIAYSLLWLHLARTRLGQDDSKELIKRSAKADLLKWPGPVLRFYLGRITADQMIAATAGSEINADKDRLCEANFFAGEDALLHLHDTAAKLLLQNALDVCPLKNLHYDAAAAELKRLNIVASR